MIKSHLSLLILTLLVFFSANTLAENFYKVEVLVFENTQGTGIDDEQWHELKKFPSDLNAVSVTNAEQGVIHQLPSDALNLIAVRKKLAESGKYRILYHNAWSQPVSDNEESTDVWIENTGVVEGTINLHKKRYLHISLDLMFNSFDGAVRLKESRRLKSKELHYFDHPLFGALVRVVKLQE